MTILYYAIITIHVIACLFLIVIVLLQQGKGQDLASAFGGGGTQTAFGPRGSANVLSRVTTVLAGVFMCTSLALTILRPRETSVLERVAPRESAAPASPAAPEPARPAPAASPEGATSPQPPAPASPSPR